MGGATILADRRGDQGQALVRHEGCLRCGFPYVTSTTRCEKMCPNCGHRDSCHD